VNRCVVVPAAAAGRERRLQHPRNLSRCQRATVAGWTSTRASLHRGHNRRKHTQSRRSDGRKRRSERPSTLNWCRRARISRKRSLRVDRADRSTATVRNASRMARRMASSRANVNDIFPSFLPVCHIGEGRRSASVGEHLLDVLGIQPAQGRLFAAGETNASGPLPPPIAILSYELWQAACDGRPIIRQDRGSRWSTP